jgi:hypothetical protein
LRCTRIDRIRATSWVLTSGFGFVSICTEEGGVKRGGGGGARL